jgi:hypothetical protein
MRTSHIKDASLCNYTTNHQMTLLLPFISERAHIHDDSNQYQYRSTYMNLVVSQLTAAFPEKHVHWDEKLQ